MLNFRTLLFFGLSDDVLRGGGGGGGGGGTECRPNATSSPGLDEVGPNGPKKKFSDKIQERLDCKTRATTSTGFSQY